MLRETTCATRDWSAASEHGVCVCVYYCSTYYKSVRAGGGVTLMLHCVCVFITAGPITKLCAWGEEESGGHVL